MAILPPTFPRRTAAPKGSADVVVEKLWPTPNRYVDDPVGWARSKGLFLWSKQREIAESIVENRYTAGQACHDVGKSFVASVITAWWLDVHPAGEAFVVTTAPTAPQVETILWREISRLHSKLDLKGYTTGGSIPSWKIDGEIVAYGRKPADHDQAAFQGIHARYVLVIIDEACGVPQSLYEAVDSLVTNENSRVLAIGNPDDPTSYFEEVCRPGSGWNRIHISAFDSPNFTDEPVPDSLRDLLVSRTWVNERKKRWGEGSPVYVSKVLGQFPEVSEDALISPALIYQAQTREIDPGLVAGRYGVDVADTGQDRTVIYLNRAGRVRRARMPARKGKIGAVCRWQGQDTMRTVGKIVRLLRADKGETGAIVDAQGIGAPVVSRLHELGMPVMGFKSSERARRPDRYKNRRAEQWWAVRELFEDGLVDLDPKDDDLASQLAQIKWSTDSSGRTYVEKKEDMKKRTKGASPDDADAFMYSTVPWDPLPPVEERGGKRLEELMHRSTEISAGVMDEEL